MSSAANLFYIMLNDCFSKCGAFLALLKGYSQFVKSLYDYPFMFCSFWYGIHLQLQSTFQAWRRTGVLNPLAQTAAIFIIKSSLLFLLPYL
jgi:hypothetical protein